MLGERDVVGRQEGVVGGELAVEAGDQPVGLEIALDLAEQTLLRIEQQQGRQRVGAEAPLKLAAGGAVLDVDAQQHEALGVGLESRLGEDLALHASCTSRTSRRRDRRAPVCRSLRASAKAAFAVVVPDGDGARRGRGEATRGERAENQGRGCGRTVFSSGWLAPVAVKSARRR